MRQHDVVVERLAVALDEQVVRRQPGAADPEAGLPDHVAQVVEERPVGARRSGIVVEVLLEGRDHPRARVRRAAQRRTSWPSRNSRTPSAPRWRRRGGRRAAAAARRPALRGSGRAVLSRCSAKSSSSSLSRSRRPGRGRRRRRCRRSAADVVLRQRLLPADQRERRREALQVPGEPAEVGLVEVVDVEDQAAVGVEVGAEVLDVQVAVHPDPAAPLVGERVRPGAPPLVTTSAKNRHARAAVEGVRVAGHRPVLRPERRRVGLHQRREGVAEDR